jgi:hypothetical protein
VNITVREVIFAAKGSSAILYRSLELRDINFTPPQTGRVVFTHHQHLILIPDQNPALICVQILIENGQTDLRLTEQIHNRIRLLTGFDLGAICKLAADCGLARGNIQPPGALGLFSKPKISWFIFGWI